MAGVLDAAARWFNENVVDPVVVSAVTALPRDRLPTAARVLADTLAGNRATLTENDFSPGELEQIRQLISDTAKPGAVTYADYLRKAMRDQASGNSLPASLMPSVFSAFDDYGNVQNTLGQFRYRPVEDGVLVEDKYDFNPYSDSSSEIGNLFGPWNIIRGTAGRRIPPGQGRQVQVKLAKDK